MTKVKKILAGAVLAVVAALGGLGVGVVASASVPDAQGEIHACYRADGLAQGQLVVMDSDVEACPTGYTELTWAQAPTAETLGLETVTLANVGGGTALCPAGKMVISGGAKWNGFGQGGSVLNTWLISSYPEPDGSGWTVVARTSGGFTYDVYATCVNE